MRLLVWLLLAVGALSLATPAQAQDMKVPGIDFMASAVKLEGQSPTTGLALRMRIDSLDLPPGLMLMPTVEWWRDKSSSNSFNFESSQRDLALGLDGAYQWQWGGFQPYMGAGFSFHFLKSNLEAPELGVPGASESSVKFGPNFLFGMRLPTTGKIQPFGEAKYQHASPARQFKINFGLGVAL
jgi:opacity protein-like surface antigen